MSNEIPKDPFNDETQNKDIPKLINVKLDKVGQETRFWEPEKDRFVSREALMKGADVVELVMTRDQFVSVLWGLYE